MQCDVTGAGIPVCPHLKYHNIKHKQVDRRFLLDLICSHKQHLD